MAGFSRTFAHLNGAALGVFGVGHLGRVIASGLIQNDFPISRLLVCHGGSAETAARLAEAGLSERIVQASELAQRSRIILYLVRPQNLNAIKNCELINDSLLISFLAGTPLARIPVRMAQGNRVRVMTSAPDTIEKRKAIGGVCPPGNPIVEELLCALRVQQIFLDKESDMHAFTALGRCGLPRWRRTTPRCRARRWFPRDTV
jgi:pyrroline-5-carboxylate reductase